MREFLILEVDLIPLPFQSFPNGIDLLFGKTFLLLIVLLVKCLDHFVLVCYVLFYFLEVLGHLAVVLFAQIVYGLGRFLGH